MKLYGNITDNNDIVNKQYVDNAVSGKQDALVSGTNIKTVNNTSLLGSGNIEIENEEEFLKATYQRQSMFSNLWELKSGETFDPSELTTNRRAVFVVDTVGTPRITGVFYLVSVLEPYDPDSPFESSGDYRLVSDYYVAHVSFYKNGNIYVRNTYQLLSNVSIKTINGESLVGSGNINTATLSSITKTLTIEGASKSIDFIETNTGMTIDAEDGEGTSICYADLTSKTYVDAKIIAELEQFEHLDYEIVQTLPAQGEAGVRYLLYVADSSTQGYHYEEYLYVENQWIDIGRFDEIDEATETTAGTIKLNPNQSIDVNANGQLTVGGRLGQFTNGGVFYPTTIEPTNVGGSTFMMTDGAKNLSLGPRTFGIMAGVSLTCKSAAAGTTQYRLSNTQSNRFACFACRGGRLAIDQTDATNNGTSLMTDISFATGNPISAYFGPTESGNDIIITVDRTVNPNASTTKLRMYGTSTSSDVIIVGQGNGAIGGKAISLGQACHAGGNQCIAFGNSSLSLANNSVALGHTNLVNKQFCFCAGQGHDFTNGSNGAGAVGIASEITSDTAFAVGNGVFNSNGNITRSNALEVKQDGSIVLKSPNGTKYKIAVDNSGNLTTTAV